MVLQQANSNYSPHLVISVSLNTALHILCFSAEEYAEMIPKRSEVLVESIFPTVAKWPRLLVLLVLSLFLVPHQLPSRQIQRYSPSSLLDHRQNYKFQRQHCLALMAFPQQGNLVSGLSGPLKWTNLWSLYSSGKTKVIGFCVEQFLKAKHDYTIL